MQDDPPEDEPEESQSDSSDVDDNDATEISEAETEKPNTGDADSNGVEEPPTKPSNSVIPLLVILEALLRVMFSLMKPIIFLSMI